MTFVLDALRDRPQGIFQMDDTSPLQDYSGYNRTGTLTGTLVKHTSLVKGAIYAPVLSSTSTVEFSSNVFKQGYEHEAFTLAVWCRVVAGTGEQQVLGNSGQMDGITVNGTVVSFVTKYATAPEARCSFDTQHEQTVSVWGVHTESKNSLYVNGELVDEVDLTEAQQADTFVATTASLFSGATAGTQTIAVNAVAFYPRALSGQSISRQFNAGRITSSPERIVSAFAGNVVPVSMQNVQTFLNQEWRTSEDWSMGSLSNVSVVDNELVPQFDGDTSVPGYWYDSIAIASAGTTSIYGVVLDWDGEGVVVETSFTGATWGVQTRGRKVTTIAEGYDPTDKVLLVRVSFPGGILNDPAYLSSLKATGILSATTNPSSIGRTITYATATPEDDHEPLELHDNWGAGIYTGGSLAMSNDPNEGSAVRSIELWIKRTGTNPVISATGTYYQNGVIATDTLDSQEWTLMHITSPTNLTGTITIAGPAQVGQIVVYDRELSATEVADIYAAYTGSNVKRVTDTSIITITEPAQAADIYAYDWSITGAG